MCVFQSAIIKKSGGQLQSIQLQEFYLTIVLWSAHLIGLSAVVFPVF